MHDFGQQMGFITAFPYGIDDAVPGGIDEGTGWNVGTAGDNQTCTSSTIGDCYRSCRIQHKCGRCNWSTCYNDELFVKTVMRTLNRAYCIDRSRIYALGESNGGMLTHYLAQRMPGTFAAVVPIFGLPLLGYAFGPQFGVVRNSRKIRLTSMLQLHDRQDTIIPVAGGLATGAILSGWIYEPLNKVQQGWAAVHGCDPEAERYQTQWDDTNKSKWNFECFAFSNCASGKEIMRCLYNGHHGDVPEFGGEVLMWFMFRQRLQSPGKPRNLLV